MNEKLESLFQMVAVLQSQLSYGTQPASDDIPDLTSADGSHTMEAVSWRGSFQQLQRVAADGIPEDQYELAICYEMGRLGLDPDPGRALYWYNKAAEQDYAPAQNSLGVLYERGDGIRRDSVKAARWYQAAAEQGDARAREYLANHYRNG